MRRIIFIYLALFPIFFSCNNEIHNQTEDIEYPNSGSKISTIKVLDDSLKRLVINFLQGYSAWDSIYKDRTFIMKFINDGSIKPFDKEDTVILVRPLLCDEDLFGSKGGLIEDSLTILIFDKHNIGRHYYTDSLLLSLQSIKINCVSDDVIGAAAFRIENGKLFYWCP
ncbi:MAG: hypothetical protein PHU33_09725 [Bacteroidales bacterium]|nr:hypothetical protein [Bacteroidales bacterium]